MDRWATYGRTWHHFQPRGRERIDDGFIGKCLDLWDMRFDTYEIAKKMFERECDVEIAVRIGRERRRKHDQEQNDDR